MTTRIKQLEDVEGELAQAKAQQAEMKRSMLKQAAYISALEIKRTRLVGDLDEIDTPNYLFIKEHKHYDKPSNWKVSVIDQDAAIKQLRGIDSSLVAHEVIERDKVDLKAIKLQVATGQLDPKQVDSLVIQKIQPKIHVKAKEN